MTTTANVVICGAGIAGIAAAYQLAARQGIRDVVLVDERPPLTLTSDKSTEAYRNWWPDLDGAMIKFMNRSLDLLEALAEACDNRFLLNRRGYLYATADPAKVSDFKARAERASSLGAGPLRIYKGQSDDPAYIPAPPEGYRHLPTGADLFLDQALIQTHFPYLTDQTVAVLHARRCGWFSGQQLGMVMLERARAHGVTLVNGRVDGVDVKGGRVQGVHVAESGRTRHIATNTFVNAAGPLVTEVGRMLDLDLPIFSELHLKAAFKDHLGIVPRHAPMFIWEDAQYVNWTEEERAFLAESEETRWLLERFPAGVHGRPEGHAESQIVLMLWAYHLKPVEPTFPLPQDPDFPELAMRGLSTMLPALKTYINRYPQVYVDGGYYTKTRENRFLCGPLPVEGAFILGALSGYGLMAACAAGELLAAHVTGDQLPDYAPAFMLSRYNDPAYQKRLESWDAYASQL